MTIELHNLPWLKREEVNPGQKNSNKIESLDLFSNFMDSNKLFSMFEKIQDFDSATLKKLSKIKMLILSNKTTDFVSKAIITTGIRHGLFFEIRQVNYSQVNEILFKKKIANFDYIFLMFDYEMFNLDQPNISTSYACNNFFQFVEKIKEIYKSNIIVSTLACPNKKIFGNNDYKINNSLQHKIEKVNRKITKNKFNAIIFDINNLANLVGTSEWFDERFSRFFQSPFSHKYIPLFSEYICKIILGNIGLSKKVLIFDLDNTIWGGIVGECGSQNLKIGKGDPLGEVYQGIQNYLINLKKIGVILAVCSKNDFENAIEPFRINKDMQLKESDISIFVANWNEKHKNIKTISSQLNLPLNSFVFFDDSKFEREIVRNYLPQVTVCELPSDPTYYTEILSSARFFESNLLSKEDKRRTSSYRSEIKRRQQINKFSNYNEYLKSLNMVLDFCHINDENIERINQLFNKTNQFNLTAKKISRTQLEKISKSDDYFSFVIRLKDKFGDTGIISSLILRKSNEVCIIENWVMSCRVFGRKVEYMIFDVIKLFLINKNIKDISGYFINTKKNNYVKNLFKDLSFYNDFSTNDKSRWILKNIKKPLKNNYPFQIKLSFK